MNEICEIMTSNKFHLLKFFSQIVYHDYIRKVEQGEANRVQQTIIEHNNSLHCLYVHHWPAFSS